MKNQKKLTPALKQYLDLKEKFKDAILMFRMGDFYEMFFEDAKVAAKELEIALTSRPFGKNSAKVPMCGVPYHAVENYITKLVKKGYKVAICEQLEEPKPGKKVVDRDVVRVITPGTYFEDETEDRFLMAIYPFKGNYCVAWCELGTGDYLFTTVNKKELLSILSKFKPREIIIPNTSSIHSLIKEALPHASIVEREPCLFSEKETVIDAENKGEVKAISALSEFVKETQKEFIPKLKTPRKYTGNRYVYIDPQTQKNLELIEPAFGDNDKASLFGVLNRTKTGMGRRLLKFWILHPLRDIKEIQKRLNAVEELTKNYETLEKLSSTLSRIYDLERLLSKITSGIANPREIAALRNSLSILPQLFQEMSQLSSTLFSEIKNDFDDLYDIYCEIERVLVENPPTSPKEGGLIKEGVNEELDELRKLKSQAESIIREIEERERQRTGISSLKVGYNNVFGYYIEVSRPNLHLIPEDYIRKQTLVNAERFITPELKEFEEKILSAQERIEKIEYELFSNLRQFITDNAHRIMKTAEKVALIDVLQSLAAVAVERDYTKPEVKESFSIYIEEGKHPVLEKFLEEDFIPNTTALTPESYILIVTGPNMGGKSVFLRQTALITLMAQIGSFVPAQKAKIGIVDRIFSRIGAADNLSKGLSTFMMEMVETANILKNATENSLIILDEIGRGTSTYDGMSIARAVVEYISEKLSAKTLFATHYHELTELEGTVKGIKNFHVSVEEINGRIVFTHKVLPGASEKSYGVHVAELAGLPKEVIKRAKEILSSLEEKTDYLPLFQNIPTYSETTEFENEMVERLLEELESIEISTTTPLEALMILSKLKEIAKTVKRGGR
ncbi:DNA mismatch repair protein MutS [Desulfurobacterium pacificum]|uniref:DNA mismatch repair protein MutS n=1 Tax=Desulfurobacterium pacificum TaxID=240166 RepID=A0ABY1NFZ2_9BACT|nr:DNA mismatch repair protein MutS [Desulfurobacterium pacificum]SMP08306.1 DNA mismatch repair protein MutS [Desulfurobacterium pacificum]